MSHSSEDPDHADEIPVEEYLLQRAVVARARSEQQLIDTVINARNAGLSWQKIGALLGTSPRPPNSATAPSSKPPDDHACRQLCAGRHALASRGGRQ